MRTIINRRTEGNCLFLEDVNGKTIVILKEILQGKELTIELNGSLTSDSTHDFEDEIVAFSIMCERIILDFKELTYISNSIIKILLQLEHMMEAKDGELIIKNMGDKVRTSFEEMGLEDVFYIV